MSFIYVKSIVYNSNLILTGNNFIGNLNSDILGSIFFMEYTNITSSEGTIFENITSKSGMTYVHGSYVNFQGSVFKNIRALETGSVIKTSTRPGSYFTFDNCVFENISA